MALLTLQRRYSYLFIDLPNVLHREGILVNVDLERLVEYIVRFAVGSTQFVQGSLYARAAFPGDMEYEKTVAPMPRIGGQPLRKMVVPRRKDVDTAMMSDIWYQTVYRSQRGNPPVRHIIVSGDKDYLQCYYGIRHAFKEPQPDIEIIVFSWRTSCSPDWSTMARIHYLDDISGILLEKAYTKPPDL